jgi:hypothetical protein
MNYRKRMVTWASRTICIPRDSFPFSSTTISMKDYTTHFRALVARELPDDSRILVPSNVKDLLILATWRLTNDTTRPNKRSRLASIVISQEALEDYARDSNGTRLASDNSSTGRAPALARRRRVRRANPTRLPESRPWPLDSVAASLPQWPSDPSDRLLPTPVKQHFVNDADHLVRKERKNYWPGRNTSSTAYERGRNGGIAILRDGACKTGMFCPQRPGTGFTAARNVISRSRHLDARHA